MLFEKKIKLKMLKLQNFRSQQEICLDLRQQDTKRTSKSHIMTEQKILSPSQKKTNQKKKKLLKKSLAKYFEEGISRCTLSVFKSKKKQKNTHINKITKEVNNSQPFMFRVQKKNKQTQFQELDKYWRVKLMIGSNCFNNNIVQNKQCPIVQKLSPKQRSVKLIRTKQALKMNTARSDRKVQKIINQQPITPWSLKITQQL